MQSLELELIYETSPAGLCFLDAELRFKRLNQRLASISGLPVEAHLGRTVREILPGMADIVEPLLRQVLQTRQPMLNLELHGRLPANPDQEFYWQGSFYPLADAEGIVLGVNVVVVDITEHKRGEQALARLASIVDFSDDAIISKDLDGKITSWNKSAERLFGYSAAEIIGQPVTRLIPEERQAAELSLLNQLLAGHPVGHYETMRIAKDGRKIDVSLSLSPIRDAQGNIIGASNITRDITERKKVEAALSESEQAFRSMADNIAPLAWMGNADGYLFFYNRRWYDYTGTTWEEMQGWGWSKVHHPDHLARVTNKWRTNLVKGEAWEDTFPLRGKDGKYRWFLSRAFPIRDSAGNILRWFGTNTDINDLREAQEALQKAQQELREHAATLEKTVAERTARLNDTIGELQAFSYSLSHDMRAPLRAIRNFSHIVLQEAGDELGEEPKMYLSKVVKSAERLDRLITDVLVFSRVSQDRIETRPLEVQPLIEQILHERPELQPPHAEIRIETPLPAILGHEASLTQCLTNLLGNAVKFVAPGVTPQVRVRGETVGNQVRLWFEDNGIGIEPAEQLKLFNIFQRLHNGMKYEGTGIGLAIVRKAVERMRGQVGVESQPGRGSKFWIQLPAAPEPSQTSQNSKAQA